MSVAEFAPAKVNLALHVLGRRPDGYHRLDTLVAFPAEIGDRVEVEAGNGLALTLDGPFADDIPADGSNLAVRAAHRLADLARQRGRGDQGAEIRLTKRVPPASGIGGGSADAAATLRALNRLWDLGLPVARLAELTADLGADLPLCVASITRRAGGTGDEVIADPVMPEMGIVLVNPGLPLATAHVFAALDGADNAALTDPPSPGASRADWLGWLGSCRNDLEAPARRLIPAIDDCRAALAGLQDCRLVRMSGAGATCFGLFDDGAVAESAAGRLREIRPDWWIAAGSIGA